MTPAVAETTLVQACCYYSTPEHVRSLVGRFVWIYTAKGSLVLTSEALHCEVSNLTCSISLRSIRRIETGYYSRWAKPVRLKYIALTYINDGQEKTVLVTPVPSWFASVWKANEEVENWAGWLKKAVGRLEQETNAIEHP